MYLILHCPNRMHKGHQNTQQAHKCWSVYCLLSTVYCLLSTGHFLLSTVQFLFAKVYFILISTALHLYFSFGPLKTCMLSEMMRKTQWVTLKGDPIAMAFSIRQRPWQKYTPIVSKLGRVAPLIADPPPANSTTVYKDRHLRLDGTVYLPGPVRNFWTKCNDAI